MNRKVSNNLSGTIFYKETSRPYINKPINLLAISEEDSSTKTTVFSTDTAGAFRLNGFEFLGPTRLLFSPVTKKGGAIDVVLNSGNKDTLEIKYPRIKSINRLSEKMNKSPFDSLVYAKGFMENIVVSTKTKDRAQMLLRRYATGRFRDLYGAVFDLTDLRSPKGNLLDYLRMRQPMIRVDIDEKNEYHIKTKNLNGELVEPALYLNEVPVLEYKQLFSVSLGDVAIIKIVQGFDIESPGRKSIPAVAIYTNKGRDFKAAGNAYDIEYMEGYSKALEFYNPVYLHKDTAGPADRRITLYWNSRAATSNRVHFIPIHFYKTDSTIKFAIKAEGITENGKLLSFYKTLF
ncbi:hypothetical protein [Niabella hirudinis]|uniref:hypothetical protein n=1 Tax=Niabella hirudinis TaxID=1285929 RepID=UPI003EBCACA4